MTQELIPAITLDDVRHALPSRKNAITQEAVDIINDTLTDPTFIGVPLLDSVVTYENILAAHPKAKVVDYVNAVKFCAYLSTMDDNATEAYKKTFYNRPFVKERYNAPTDSVEYKELTSAASRYRQSKLVVEILTVSQVPLDLLFTGKRYEALNVLASEMYSAPHAKDRILAATNLLAETRSATKLQVSVGLNQGASNAVEQMLDSLTVMANRQRELLTSGTVSLTDLGSITVVDNTGVAIDGD